PAVLSGFTEGRKDVNGQDQVKQRRREGEWNILGEARVHSRHMVLEPVHRRRIDVASPYAGQGRPRQEMAQEPAASRAEIEDSTKVRPLHAERGDGTFQRRQGQASALVKPAGAVGITAQGADLARREWNDCRCRDADLGSFLRFVTAYLFQRERDAGGEGDAV